MGEDHPVTQRFIDDATGEIITEGRSYQVGIHYESDKPQEPLDFCNLDDMLDTIRAALESKSRPPLQIIVRSWEHIKPTPRSWQS